MSAHEGHRQRMKTRFSEEGLEHFADHEVLEILLYYSIPRKDARLKTSLNEVVCQ